MSSSDDGDIIEIESSADTESNLNTENQSQAEDAIDSLNVTNDTSENEAKESEQETSKGHEKAQNVAEGVGATSSKPKEYTGKKAAETKNPKPEKKPQESSSKTKSSDEKINSDPKASNMATRSSSPLKSVPVKLRNYFTEQDEEYFSRQETNDVFVSRNSREIYWNRKEGRVRPERRVMDYHYVCFWYC